MDSGTPFVSIIYFYVLILLGAYFILNLILAVILSSFLKIQEAQESEENAQNLIKGMGQSSP